MDDDVLDRVGRVINKSIVAYRGGFARAGGSGAAGEESKAWPKKKRTLR
jgi:hypothetical protein